MSFIVTDETPYSCCTQHRAARIENTSDGKGYTVTRDNYAIGPASYCDLPDGVSIAGAWDAGHLRSGKYADELGELLGVIYARHPSSEAEIEGRYSMARTGKPWDDVVKRWAKIGGAKHVEIGHFRPDKSSLYVLVVITTDEYDGDAAKLSAGILRQYEAWIDGNVYGLEIEDGWTTCYGVEELADVIKYNMGAEAEESLELARRIEEIV